MYLDIIVLEEEKDRIKRISTDFPYITFSDLGKCETGAPLEVNVVRIDEGAESIERRSSKEISLSSVLKVAYRISD